MNAKKSRPLSPDSLAMKTYINHNQPIALYPIIDFPSNPPTNKKRQSLSCLSLLRVYVMGKCFVDYTDNIAYIILHFLTPYEKFFQKVLDIIPNGCYSVDRTTPNGCIYHTILRRNNTMTRDEYLRELFKAYNEGRISEEAYDNALMNIDEFCEEE